MDVLIAAAALGLLMLAAYRGLSVIVMAPLLAMLAAPRPAAASPEREALRLPSPAVRRTMTVAEASVVPSEEVSARRTPIAVGGRQSEA